MLAAAKSKIPRLDYLYSFYYGFLSPHVQQQLIEKKLVTLPRHYTQRRASDPFMFNTHVAPIPTILNGAENNCKNMYFFNGCVFDECDIVTVTKSLATSLTLTNSHARK